MSSSALRSLTLFTLLVGTGPSTVPTAPRADALAAELLQALHGTSVSDWRARVPDATWQRYYGTYEEIGESPEERAHRGIQPSGFWCAVATDRHEEVERVAVFFALRDTSPAACRVELFQGVVWQGTEPQATAMFDDVSALVSQQLGVPAHPVELRKGTTPEPYGGGTGYPDGVERWETGVAWHQGDRDLFLFRAARAVGFASRSSLLTPASEDAGEPNNVSQDAEQRLAAALRHRIPAAAVAMSFPSLVPEHQSEIRAALIEVLDARGSATANDQAMLSFAADRLARKLWIDPPFPSGHPELLPLRRRQVTFTHEPRDDLWMYDGAFSSAVLRLWPDTSWGQLAFVTHLYEGYTEDRCNGRAYENVIRYGNAWLRSHPDSQWRTTVLTAVARAYETQWALAGGFTADARQNARVVTKEQASARMSAIRLYDEVIRLASDSQDAAYARRRIIQLRANMTTSQDAYSCVYA